MKNLKTKMINLKNILKKTSSKKTKPVSYTHLRAHETVLDLVCRLLLEKKIIIEALWKIIYSDENADMYETNLMRRLSGLLYLDNKVVGDIKEKVKQSLK